MYNFPNYSFHKNFDELFDKTGVLKLKVINIFPSFSQ